MERNGLDVNTNKSKEDTEETPLVWDWDIEQEDRKREAKHDASLHGAVPVPFEVDRRVLKDVVREKMGLEIVRIQFLSSGTFHKAYLITLADKVELVGRVARRFMPRLKVESEVATIQYLRDYTNVPVPIVLHHDSNPYNRLGGEYILMSKAKGVPLAEVYHSLPYNDLVQLLRNMAKIVIPLFSHRFPSLGSLYSGPDPNSSTSPTPRAVHVQSNGFPFGMTPLSARPPNSDSTPTAAQGSLTRIASTNGKFDATFERSFHIGPIISWPFFGSNRGELIHPREINRGPWTSSKAYFDSCVEREINGVRLENEGKSAPHKLHLDPDEVNSSRHHQLQAVPDDMSDDSDEWDLEESEDEWEGPGDAMYRDYRRMQRTTFLFTHLQEREDCVKEETARWVNIMERLVKQEEEMRKREMGTHARVGRRTDMPEEFGLDCHDLSLENIFVDPQDPTKITCIIDWESTTTRPLWQSAHLPAFLQSSPFTAKLFREIVVKMASCPPSEDPLMKNFANVAQEWLYYEAAGTRLRMAHRFVEWDGWEEGLAESMLGLEEFEEDWFKEVLEPESALLSPLLEENAGVANEQQPTTGELISRLQEASLSSSSSSPEELSNGNGNGIGVGKLPPQKNSDVLQCALARRIPSTKIPVMAKESEKENVLNTTGDICGGRGGELGRRLEAWLTVNGHETEPDREKSVDGPRRRWHNEESEE